MMRATNWIFAGAIAAMLMIPRAAAGQEKAAGHGDAAAPAASPSKPGVEQAELAKMAGEYARVIKFVGPQAEGIPHFAGTAKISVVLGGRFLLEESSDVVMGQKVDALRLYGYNNSTKQYEMARTYTMSTAITMMTGTSSDGGTTIEFNGGIDGGKTPLHAHYVKVDEDHFTVTMSTAGADGKDAPFQETDYARKK
jgi:hypothetical protein